MKKDNLVLVFLGLILVGLFVSLSLIENRFDKRGKAVEKDFEPWNFVVLGDTQTHSEVFYDWLSDSLAAFKSRMILHLGDYTFGKRGDSLVNKVILRLRGDGVANYGKPIEFHGANGNHGAGYNKAMNDLSRNFICLGKFVEEVDSLSINGKLNYGLPQKNEALNPDVQKQFSYCVPSANFDTNNIQLTFPSERQFFQQYSFERSGLRVLVTGFGISGFPDRVAWIKEELCKHNNSSATIIITHDAPCYDCVNSNRFWQEIIDQTTCPQANLKAVIGGHVHTYSQTKYKEVVLMSVSGMFFGEFDPDLPEFNGWEAVRSDYWIANVHRDRIDFSRYQWGEGRFIDQGVKFSIPGVFTSYAYGGATPTSTPTPIPTSSPTPIPTRITTVIPTITISPTPTPTTTDITTSVSIDISFAGIKPNTSLCFNNPVIDVFLINQNQDSARIESMIVAKTNRVNNKGETIYNLSGSLSKFKYGDSVSVFIKGPNHLMTKYGQDNQTSFYNQVGSQIKLQPAKTLNFTNYSLSPGDVNSDGKVDGLDFAKVKLSASTFSTTDTNSDLDGSCQVNNIDLSLLVNTLSVKQEQVY